jgi:hypothetical protein
MGSITLLALADGEIDFTKLIARNYFFEHIQ